MTVLGMLAWCAAAVSLWLGARRYESAVARAYRWLAAGAALYCSGLVVQGILGGTLNPAPGLSFTDLPPLLALAAVAIGIAMLTMAEREVTSSPQEGSAGSVLPGLADGYVMAVALLVIGWSTLFSAEFHRSGERPGTFLLALIHPLADLAVLGALLPMVTTAWRRVALPYLSLLAVALGDALAVGQRVLGGHLGVAGQLMPVVAALLLGAAPWRMTEGFGTGWARRTSSSAAATIIAVLAACVATLVVIANGLAGAPASGIALIVAGGAGVLVLAARVFMLLRENLAVLGIWRESSRSLRDLANRTSDVVLVCDLDGVVRYASPAVEDYGYPPGTLTGRRLLDFVHPEDRPAVLASVRLALGGYAEGAEGFEGLEGSGRFPVRVRAADGTWRHVESTLLRYQAPGEPVQMLVTARDVSDQVALRQQVTHLTFHDGLTGLPNRAYVEERARDVLQRRRGGRQDRRHLPGPGPLHRGQRLGRPRRGRPRAGPGGQAAARRRPGARHGGPLGQRRVRRPGRERRRRSGGRGDRRAAGRRGRRRAVPGGRPADRADRERRRRAGRRGPARAGAAQRGRGHVAGQGRWRRPGRGLRRAHARGRGPQAGDRQRPDSRPSATASSPCSTSRSWSWPPRG